MSALGLDARFHYTCALLDLQPAVIAGWIHDPEPNSAPTLLGAATQVRVPVARAGAVQHLGLAVWVVVPNPSRPSTIFAVSTYSDDINLANYLRIVEATPSFDALVRSWPLLTPVLNWQHPALTDADREFLVRAAALRP